MGLHLRYRLWIAEMNSYINLLPHSGDEEFKWQEQDIYNGVFIPVDPDTMIERIYISPYSPK